MTKNMNPSEDLTLSKFCERIESDNKNLCITWLVCIYMNGIIPIKYSTIPRSNPKYTRYHHKAYIFSLK
jgi:hypothetical protein